MRAGAGDETVGVEAGPELVSNRLTGGTLGKKKLPHILPDAINPLHQARVVGRLVRKVTKKPGTAPGTLVHTGVKKVEQIRIRYLDYDLEQLSEAQVEVVEKCFPFKDSPTVSWINVDGLHDVDLVRMVGERFKWHPLLLEDIVGVGQRAKVEEYDGYLYVVIPMLSWDAQRRQVVDEQLSLILGERYVFTFQERWGDAFEPVRERLRQAKGRIRARGSDYLAYALVDAVVDHYFDVLEKIGDVTEELEEEVLKGPEEATMHRLHALKRELIAVRRAVWPVRDMLAALVRNDEEYFRRILNIATQRLQPQGAIGGAEIRVSNPHSSNMPQGQGDHTPQNFTGSGGEGGGGEGEGGGEDRGCGGSGTWA